MINPLIETFNFAKVDIYIYIEMDYYTFALNLSARFTINDY